MAEAATLSLAEHRPVRIDEVREATSKRILAGLFPDGPTPKARAAINGWLWYMDGVLLDWIEHRDLERYGAEAERMRLTFNEPGAWTGTLEAYAEAFAS